MSHPVKDGAGASRQMDSTGDGSLGSPTRPRHWAVLEDDQLEALTPPDAITGFATETTLSAVNGKLPALGQALAAASVPVVLTAAQQTALTPPAAITGFATSANQTAEAALIGAVNETAPANDIASSGLNGRLQRIAQNLATYLGSLTETAPATDTASSALNGRLQRIAQNITTMIGRLPAALGQATMANSLAVTLASNQSNVPTIESWRVSTLSFTTADDSDNTFTVPANTEYQILSVYVSLVTTATVGNRQMAVQALDASDNVLIGARAGAVQAASLTRVYNFAPGLGQDTAFRDTDYLAVSMPPIFLAAGQKLRVWDKAAVAAAADDMTVRVQIASRSIA